MKNLRLVLLGAALTSSCISTTIFVAPTTASAQAFAASTLTLEKAAHAELVLGDIESAISLYEDVAGSAAASRADVSRALVALGHAYEMMDPDRSVRAYERVTSEFSDFDEAFQQARSGLIRMGVQTELTKQDYKLVMADIPPTNSERRRSFDFSPDGTRIAIIALASDYRKVSFPDLRRELFFKDVGSDILKPVIKDPGSISWMSNPRWSPDGDLIAIGQTAGTDFSLAIANVASGELNVLRGDIFTSRVPPIWMPDSRSLVVYDMQNLSIVGLDGVVVSSIPFSQPLHNLNLSAVSPNGELLLFHRMPENSDLNEEVDIWTINLRSGEQVQITHESGFEGWPVWNADGSAVFYSGGTESARNIYKRGIASGDVPQKLTAYTNAFATTPVYIRSSGAIGYVLANRSSTIMMADGAGSSESPTLPTATPILRGSLPELSPDGRRVYYLDNQPGRSGIWSAGVDGSEIQNVVSGRISRSYGTNDFLSPDGSKIAFFKYVGEEAVLYVCRSDGHELKELYRIQGRPNVVATWSSDGREVAFTDGGELKVANVTDGDVEMLASIDMWEGWTVTWAPDGPLIAGLGFTGNDGENSVFVVNRDSREVTQLTDRSLPKYKEILSWHPDGDRISYMYYGSEIDGKGDDGSLVVSVDNAVSSVLADIPGPMWDYMGVFGPQGSYYFVSAPPGVGLDWRLYKTIKGSTNGELVRHAKGADTGLPTWSEDGSIMAWHETKTQNQLWILSNY